MYQREIDGLRALSVLLIIPFHLQIPTFIGGFVGLEVFFVISGFLITNMVLRELDAGRFSLREFYVRRIARLVPALVATVALTVLAASVLFSPRDLVEAARQGLYAIVSLSNLYFWSVTDYWAPDAKGFVLLHTWSLGVEEQFYLVYPLLLLVCHRYLSRGGLWIVLLLMFVGGAAANHVVLQTDRVAAYFLSPLRFYEFALGGLGSLWFLHREAGSAPRARGGIMATLATLAGLGLIIYPAFSFHPLLRYPGLLALVPASGALLVVLAGATPLASLVLGNSLMVRIGKLSYSLYLVHWPLIVFYRHHYGPELSLADCAVLLLASFALALVLNRAVELPLRLTGDGRVSRGGVAVARVMWATGAAVLLTCALTVIVIRAEGWPDRLPEHLRELSRLDQTHFTREERQFMEEHCRPRGEVFCGRPVEDGFNIMLLGDSRALDIYVALSRAYPEANIYTSYALGCPPVFDPNIGRSQHYAGCSDLNRARLGAALAAPRGSIVFLALDFDNWRASFVLDTVQRLVASGKRVYVLGESRFLHGKMPREIAIDQERSPDGARYVERYLVRNPFALDEKFGPRFAAMGATYISTRKFFHDGQYRLYTRDGKQMLTLDGIHLSTPGAEEFGDYLAQHYPIAR